MANITERQTGSASLATMAQLQKTVGIPADGQVWVTNSDGSDLIILDTTTEIDANLDVGAGRNLVFLGRGVYDPFMVTSFCSIAGVQGSTFITDVADFTLADEMTVVKSCIVAGAFCDISGVNVAHTGTDIADDLILVYNENGYLFMTCCEVTSTATLDGGSIKLMDGAFTAFVSNTMIGLGSTDCSIEGTTRICGGLIAVGVFGSSVICSGPYVVAGAITPATGMFFNGDDLVYSDGVATHSLKALLTA